MNKFILTALLGGTAIFVGCGDSRSTEIAKAPGAGNSNVSFGMYDLSSSQTTSAQRDVVANSSAQNKLAGPSGGGGGGGRDPQVITDNISLNQASASQVSPIERKIVRNGELHIECEQPDAAQQRISQIAQTKNGFVVESQQSTSDVKVSTRDIVQMTVRVPADKFTETVDEIKASAGRVIQETTKGEDVTEEFIDIDARLKAKKALELQFMEIMKRANSVDDALSVHGQLAEVRGEIEKIEGRKRFLENQASLSTIKIKLQTPAVFSTNSSGFSYRLSESFGSGFDIALNFILGLVTFVVGALPLLVFVGLPGYLIVRAIMRKRSRPMSVTDIAKEELPTD